MAQQPGRSSSGSDALREIALDEIMKHNKKEDAWMAVRGKVYNVTDFIKKHPGGVPQIMKGIGLDATTIFESITSHARVDIDKVLAGKQIGTLKGYKPTVK